MNKVALNFLFRIADMMYGNREARFATLKTFNEAKRIKRMDVVAMCRVYIVAMLDETDDRQRLWRHLEKSEEIII
jgi:hypothetical protein